MAIIKPNNNTLSSITALPTGLGGKVLQVVYAKKEATASTTSTSFVEFLTANITPSSSSNKILVISGGRIRKSSTGSQTGVGVQITRDTTQIALPSQFGLYTNSTVYLDGSFNNSVLDTPSTTSQITYKINFRTTSDGSGNSGGEVSIGTDNSTVGLTLMEIAG